MVLVVVYKPQGERDGVEVEVGLADDVDSAMALVERELSLEIEDSTYSWQADCWQAEESNLHVFWPAENDESYGLPWAQIRTDLTPGVLHTTYV